MKVISIGHWTRAIRRRSVQMSIPGNGATAVDALTITLARRRVSPSAELDASRQEWRHDEIDAYYHSPRASNPVYIAALASNASNARSSIDL